MSGALPFPSTMSDNRSFISDQSARLHGGSFFYANQYDDERKAPVQRFQPPYRPIPPSSSRHAQATSSLSSAFHEPVRVQNSGSYGSPSDVHTPVSFSQELQSSTPYRDHYSQMNSSAYYSAADCSLPYSYPQPARLPDACSIASHSSSSHSPPAGPEQQLSPVSDNSQQAYSLSRPSSKRREKPRIALSPDQPLTTQGRPRARVYVACVQW